ncbi:CidA/LrgA family protein [Salipaludibacillus sp. CUR1]|uniref:CidA/LrgA family protein n=1 Tax=Salipaludibacillus sp. CUR1 TaxID=2820003 RepID=UPI001E60ED0A|nr:CidA/LrgA family protein [Salipaludibacillus sp. CUR1]MCE7794829.1 CidA/LrgA family protein [Salipaludibacillus sp. CUR1]
MWKEYGIMLIQIGILWFINQIGNYLVGYTGLAIPGNVAGMLILFFLLGTGLLPLSWVEKGAALFVKHLGFFFIPICVGIMAIGHMAMTHMIYLLVIITCSTLAGLVATGKVSQVIGEKRRGENGSVNNRRLYPVNRGSLLRYKKNV